MNTETLIGKTIEEAEQICKDSNYSSRIASEDGKNYVGTCDFDINRINFEVAGGIIIEANIG